MLKNIFFDVGIFDLYTVEENNGEGILKVVLKTAFSSATT